MMSIGEYTLAVAACLARRYPVPQNSALIAEGTKIPHMVRGELILSRRDSQGGFVSLRVQEWRVQ